LLVASSDIILLPVRPSSAPDDSVGLGLPDAEPLSNVALPHALLGESADGPDIALAEASVRVLLTASLGPQTPTLGVRDVLLRRDVLEVRKAVVALVGVLVVHLVTWRAWPREGGGHEPVHGVDLRRPYAPPVEQASLVVAAVVHVGLEDPTRRGAGDVLDAHDAAVCAHVVHALVAGHGRPHLGEVAAAGPIARRAAALRHSCPLPLG